jgi:hypothetical protein
MMSALTSSLGIISSNSAPDDWAFFPIESYVFAFGSSNVSIVRMRVQIRNPDGAIPGEYASQVVWKGSLSQWDEKVRALNERAKTLDLGNDGNACLKKIKECEAEEIDVVFFTRGGQNGRRHHRVFDEPGNVIGRGQHQRGFREP